jgi:hypothetical protein
MELVGTPQTAQSAVQPQTASYAEIPLTQGKVALVDDDDLERVLKHIWVASLQRGKWYAVGVVQSKLTYLHRFILDLNSSDPEIDHIDRNGLDCRRSNMRLATRSQQMANQKKQSDTSSRFKGVTWLNRNKKWMAQIKVDGKHRYLGSFVDEEDAARAYDKAAKEAWSEFARTNF